MNRLLGKLCDLISGPPVLSQPPIYIHEAMIDPPNSKKMFNGNVDHVMRLYVGRWRKICVGDLIRFTESSTGRRHIFTVTGLNPKQYMDLSNETRKNLEWYYPEEDLFEFGAVEIGLQESRLRDRIIPSLKLLVGR